VISLPEFWILKLAKFVTGRIHVGLFVICKMNRACTALFGTEGVICFISIILQLLRVFKIYESVT
jgi:hypothetical protein